MGRNRSLVVAFVGLLGVVGLVPVAQADHYITGDKPQNDTTHDAAPTALTPFPGGECAVLGEVSINVGVDTTPRHNHYKFRDTLITCAAGLLPDRFSGDYRVDAAGGTDGPGNPTHTMHGADDLRGWSHKSCYIGVHDPGCDGQYKKGDDASDFYDGTHRNGDGSDCWNCGEIEVEHRSGSPSAIDPHNAVMFDRFGSTVFVWGELHETSDGGLIVCFLAELEFTPTNLGANGFNRATLGGDAHIWDAAWAPCGVDNPVNKNAG